MTTRPSNKTRSIVRDLGLISGGADKNTTADDHSKDDD